MNFSFFVAKRFFKNIGGNKRRASNPTIAIATAGVAMGLAVMIVTLCVIYGFKSEITKKVEGFGSHIEVFDLKSLTAPDAFPIEADAPFLNALRKLPAVKSVDQVAAKMGILKTENDFASITLKGIPPTYDTTFFAQNIVEGRLPRLHDTESNEILISRRQADDLHLKVGDRVYAYFFEESIKTRRFTISGIYQSNMTIFDKNFIIGNLGTVVRLNHWDGEQATALEVRLHNSSDIDRTTTEIRHICQQMNTSQTSQSRLPMSSKERFASIFAWLDLLDFNMAVILVLMVVVSGFTMISGLFILILERTQTIGLLKALGASNTRIRSIFLHFAAMITLRGLLIGDILALLLLFVQQRWGIIHLDPATYYVETVPVVIDLPAILFLNLATLLITILALVAPSYMISRIQPAKSIRFE